MPPLPALLLILIWLEPSAFIVYISVLPSLLDTNAILGEKIVGSDSKAVAQLTTRVSATEVEICYLTPERFKIGESLTFKESNIITNLQDKTPGSYLNITEKFTLNKGQ